MSISLYAATVPTWLQLLGTVSKLVDKADAWCTETGTDPAEIIDAKLAPDMFNFAYQVKSTAVHSWGAIEGVRRGLFEPDMTPPPTSFDGMRQRISEAVQQLEGLDPAELETFIGRDMRFQMGKFRLDFTAENFLLSFSQPNFHFHATTAYDLLRMKGLPIGKGDYMGRMALKS